MSGCAGSKISFAHITVTRFSVFDTLVIVIREKVQVYPLSWATSFGVPVSYLEQHHYSGEWDVLRPAKELEDMNTITADRLAALMKEAETIMEGWTKTA